VADAVLVVNTGDSLASDPEIIRWVRAGGQTPFAGGTGFDVLVLSQSDLWLAQTQGLIGSLPVTGTVLLSADVVNDATGQLVVKPYTLQTVRGYRLALLGLTGVISVPGFHSLDPVSALTRAMTQIRGKADIVLLLSNAGPEVERVLAAQVPGLDAIISGGEPGLDWPERDPATGVCLLRTGYAGRAIGVARLTFDARGHLQRCAWERRLFTVSQ